MVGIVFIFNRPITNYLIEDFHPVIFRTGEAKQKKAPYKWDDVKPINLFTVIKARLFHPEIQVVGGIYNEKLGLNVPISNGVDSTIYSLCAGTLHPDEQMGKGNYAIAAHNVPTSKDALFSPLYEKAKVGDVLYVTDFNKVYSYKIYSKSTISEHDQGILTPSKEPKLTLITCEDTNNSKRVVFQAKLTKTSSYNNISNSTRAFLNEKYAVKDSRWDTIHLRMFNFSNKNDH